MTYSLTRFGVYDELKKRLTKRHPVGQPLPAWEMAAAASVAGGLGGLAGNPADVILVRMTADAAKPAAERLEYKHWCAHTTSIYERHRRCNALDKREELTELVLAAHSFDGVFRIIREEGASALFRGVGPNCARAILMSASQLAT